MKRLVATYSFSAAAKTVALNDVRAPIYLERLLLIVNSTRNVIYYNFADTTIGTASSDGAATITFTASTAGHADTDKLVILYDDIDLHAPLEGSADERAREYLAGICRRLDTLLSLLDKRYVPEDELGL